MPLRLFGDGRDQTLKRAIAYALAEMDQDWRNEHSAERDERNAAVAKLQGDVDELRGKLNAMLVLLGGAVGATKMLSRTHDAGGGDVVELPKGFLRRVHNG